MNFLNGQNILDSTDFIILKLNNTINGNIKACNIDICGRKSVDWLKNLANGRYVKVVNFNENQPLLPQIKPYLGNGKYTVVLYSDTPLLTYNSMKSMVEYAYLNEFPIVKFPRAYVFQNSHLDSINTILSNNEQNMFQEEFFRLTDLKSYITICDIIKNRIMNYHISNGVIFKDINSVSIDAGVVIENNVMIEANNVIKGKTHIGPYTIIGNGNTINNCVIGETNEIYNSVLNEVGTEKNVKIMPFCIINQSIIFTDCVINSFSNIKNQKIKPSSVVKPYTNLT